MLLSTLDIVIVLLFFVVFLCVGIYFSKKSLTDSNSFFLSGRNMPWWLLGFSMVATTFSADTPNLVTQIVREKGVWGNWEWWIFLLTGMLTVFVYAKLWRRSGVTTDLEFYKLRYSGVASQWLRVFRAIYLGVFFNVFIMASVCLAGIKIGGVLFGLDPVYCVLITGIVTVVYSSLGGIKGVIVTDFIQFIIAMIGSIWAMFYILDLPQINGLNQLLSHPNVTPKIDFFPSFEATDMWYAIFLVPLLIQWWSAWYPGAEPGGGGYIAQRMLSAKDENHATAATLLFNVAHYALRPWPWILIALASLVVYPDLSSIATAFPQIPSNQLGNDLAYPAMLTTLPHGLLGIIVTSLAAALMSTLSTHLNWGASYLVLDVYKYKIDPYASEREQITVGFFSTVILMLLAGIIALSLSDAMQGFQILLQIGAGTGGIFILRWFWWRINAYTEITGMLVSFLVAIFFEKIYPEYAQYASIDIELTSQFKLIAGTLITTVSWVFVTLLTQPTDIQVLKVFYEKIQPYGNGWKGFLDSCKQSSIILNLKPQKDNFTKDLLFMLSAIIVVYSALFAMGSFIYGNTIQAIILTTVVLLLSFMLFKLQHSSVFSNSKIK